MKILDSLSVDVSDKNIRYYTNVNNGIKPFLINELKLQIKDYEKLIIHKDFVISEQDSLVLLLEKKYGLCEERLKEVEPGFFDNKYLWFLFGLFSQEGIKNIK